MKPHWDGVWKIINPTVNRVGPDNKVHQGWCQIFMRDACNCHSDGDDGGDGDDDGRRGGPYGGNKLKIKDKVKKTKVHRREREFA